MGDRAVGNFLEQAIMFLPLLWMHAVFVDPTQSWTLALIYLVSRALYLVVYPLDYSWFQGALGISTAPGYMVNIYCMHQLATKFVFA